MDDIIEKAKVLGREIKESESYLNYLRYKTAVESEPQLYDRLKAFRKAQIDFQMKMMQNQPVSFEEEKNVSALYSHLMLNEDAGNFLKSEKKLLNLLSAVYEAVGNGCVVDFELGAEPLQ